MCRNSFEGIQKISKLAFMYRQQKNACDQFLLPLIFVLTCRIRRLEGEGTEQAYRGVAKEDEDVD